MLGVYNGNALALGERLAEARASAAGWSGHDLHGRDPQPGHRARAADRRPTGAGELGVHCVDSADELLQLLAPGLNAALLRSCIVRLGAMLIDSDIGNDPIVPEGHGPVARRSWVRRAC